MFDSNKEINLAQLCSRSCARAGIFALVLSGVALILIPLLNKTENVLAFQNYFNLRIELRNLIKSLTNDECWKNYQKDQGEEVVGNWQLHELLEKMCPPPSTKKNIKSSSSKSILEAKSINLNKNKNSENNAPTTSSKISKDDKTPPAAPTGITIIGYLPYKDDLESNLRALNDQEMLRKAAVVSLSINIKIMEWQQELYRMLKGSRYSTEKKKELRRKKIFPNNDNWDIYLYFLTFENIKTLDNSNYPTLEEMVEVKESFFDISLPWAKIPLTLGAATTFIEFGLFLCSSYFWLFLRESRNLSPSSLAGTLIGVMKKDRYSISLFLFLTIIPLGASLGLAFSSLHVGKLILGHL